MLAGFLFEILLRPFFLLTRLRFRRCCLRLLLILVLFLLSFFGLPHHICEHTLQANA